MTSSNSLKKLISIGAAMLLAVGGSLVAAQPASASANSNVGMFDVLRLTSATRAAGGSTYVVHPDSNKTISSFNYDENFAAQTGAGTFTVVFTLPNGVTVNSNPTGSNTITVTNTTTTVNPTAPTAPNASSPYTTYSSVLVADSNRTGENIRVSLSLRGATQGADVSIGVLVTYGGTQVAPTGSYNNVDDGHASARGTGSLINYSADTYTTQTGDLAVSASGGTASAGCIWTGSGTVAAGQVFQPVWTNAGPTSIASTYTVPIYYTSASMMPNIISGSTSFTVPNPAPENIKLGTSKALFVGFSVGDIIDPAVKFVKQGTSTDLLEPCKRVETLPAVTAAAGANNSITVTLTPPSGSSHFSSWDGVRIYACVTTLATCGQLVDGWISSNFQNMSMGQPVQTSATSFTGSTFMASSPGSQWSTTTQYKYFALYDGSSPSNNYYGITGLSAAVAVSSGSGSGSGSSSSASSSSASTTESAKPLPVWAAPILKQIPTLSKTLTTEGGKLSLTDGDFSSLKSVTVGGKEVAYSIDAKGDVNIPVPAGKGGTTADLVVVFTGGKMTVQDGIKYVEPTNVAAVREAPIAGFKGNSTKITGALAETIQYAAQLDKKANTVLCTGYAASKAAVATATARAEAACGYATKVNDLLVNKKVTIVVNAKLAKTAAVGIKVYK